MKILETIQKLRRELKDLENNYYSGNPTASDDIYDHKLRELANLEYLNPDLISEDSPTQKVGFFQSENTNIEHEVPMLSLANAFNEKDLDNFFKQCEKDSKDLEYILEPKIDGISISIKYEGGYLKKGISRGDGKLGEDLTSKILQIKNIPIKLNDAPKNIQIRGEIYITKTDFLNINKDKKFANQRNFAAGTLRLKESISIKDKKLSFLAYQIIDAEKLEINTQYEVLQQLTKWGFLSHSNLLVSRDKKEIREYVKRFENMKKEANEPMDGLVIKVNNLQILEHIGFTSKYPKWAIAYKYPSLIKESKLIEIFPTVGRTGKITYLAKIERIEIEGSEIEYATLHNKNYISNLDIRIGDYVYVYKSGEIIPKIIGVNKDKRTDENSVWIADSKCPSCNSDLIETDSLSTQFCVNKNCEEKEIALLVHWTSKKGIDINGISKKIIKKLYKLGFVKNIKDIYEIKNKRDSIIHSNIKIKEKTIDKLLLEIEKSKSKDLKKVLSGLGIPFLGEEMSYLITQKYTNIDLLMNATKEELLSIEGIGYKTAESLIMWIKENKEFIEDMKNIGFFKNIEDTKVRSFLTSKNVVITGTLSIPREKIKQILQKTGAIIKSKITNKTDYLIAGENEGSKLQEAINKGIKILKEEDIKEILSSGN